MMMKRASLLLLAFSLIGCAEADRTVAGLTYEEGADGVTGTYVTEAGVPIEFESRMIDGHVLDLLIDMNGMLITALVDFETGVIEHDGFALENAEDTQMLDEDRAALLELAHALDGLGEDVSVPMNKLRTFASTWSEFPTSVELQGITFSEENRSYTSICQYVGQYVQVTHDGWFESRGDDDTTYNAYMSMHSDGPCSDGTYFWNGSSWQCYEPDHSSSVEWAYGGCFGRCGGGCGSDTQFTWDCADHDSCVRFGHSLASLWCDDEFLSTVDDWAVAPNCG